MDKVNHACLFPFPAQLYPSDKKLVIVNTSNVRAVELRVSNVPMKKLSTICCMFIQMKIQNRKSCFDIKEYKHFALVIIVRISQVFVHCGFIVV